MPGESGFKVVGNRGQDKLRMVAYPNPAVDPTMRIDQRKGLTKVTKLAAGRGQRQVPELHRGLAPCQRQDLLQGHWTRARSSTPTPTTGPIIKARGGADVITGLQPEADLLIGGKGFDIGFGKGGKDRCQLIERRKSC